MNLIPVNAPVADPGGNLIKPGQSAPTHSEKSGWFAELYASLLHPNANDADTQATAALTLTAGQEGEVDPETMQPPQAHSGDGSNEDGTGDVDETLLHTTDAGAAGRTIQAEPDSQSLSDHRFGLMASTHPDVSSNEGVAGKQTHPAGSQPVESTPTGFDGKELNASDAASSAGSTDRSPVLGGSVGMESTPASRSAGTISLAPSSSEGGNVAQADLRNAVSDSGMVTNSSQHASESGSQTSTVPGLNATTVPATESVTELATNRPLVHAETGANAAPVDHPVSDEHPVSAAGTGATVNVNSMPDSSLNKAETTPAPIPGYPGAVTPGSEPGPLNASGVRTPGIISGPAPASAPAPTSDPAIPYSQNVNISAVSEADGSEIDTDPDAAVTQVLNPELPRTERHTQPGTDRAGEAIRSEGPSTMASSSSANGGGLSFSQNGFTGVIPETLLHPESVSAADIESWKEAVQATGLEVLGVTEPSIDGFSRLSQFAVPNLLLRRELLPAMEQLVKQVSESVKTPSEAWQKHHFVMDDGQRVDVMVRQVEGVLHLKLSSSNPELSRLLEEYARDIEEHLRETLSIDLNLQSGEGTGGGQSLAQAFGDAKGKHPYQKGLTDLLRAREVTVKPQQASTVRYFGYNRNEWTA